jgi:hypothetical protein
MKIALVFLFFSFFTIYPGWSSDSETPESRSLLLGFSGQNFLLSSSETTIAPLGMGVFANYEYHIGEMQRLGINLAYRDHRDKGFRLFEFGYGLILKHYITKNDLNALLRPFVDYGLLLQIIGVSDRIGTVTAHDTRMTIGTDIQLKSKCTLFIAAVYHFSRPSYFTENKLFLDTLGAEMGYKFSW